MADGANLFDLAAKISVDASQSDRSLTATQQKVLKLAQDFTKVDNAAKKTQTHLNQTSASGSKLSDVFRGLSTSVTTMNGPLNGVSGRISSLSSLFTGLTTSAGVVGIAIGALAAVSVGAAAGIYHLATSVADATGKFKDLSQQTGFSVETLSALNNAAETSGGSIESVTNALFIFETKMGEAKDKTSEMGKIFKELNIDTSNNEKALRQALAAVQGLTNAEDKATLGKKLFGRSVKDLLGALAEAGSLDAFLNKQIADGTLITTQMAEEADKLSDAVREMGRQFEAVKRLIAAAFGPEILNAVKALTQRLRDNQPVLQEFATAIGDAARGIGYLVGGIRDFSNALRGLIGIGVPEIFNTIMSIQPAMLAFRGLAAIGRKPTVSADTQSDMLRMNNLLSNRPQSLRGVNPFGITTMPSLGGGGGGRGGGGVKADPGVRLLQQLEDQFKNLTPRTEAQKVQEQLLGKEFDKTADAIKKKIIVTAMDIDQQKMITGITRERTTVLQKLREEFEKFVELVQQSSGRRRSVRDLTGLDFFDLGGGSVYGAGEGSSRPRTMTTGATRPRIATAQEQVLRDQLAMFHERMRYLAGDLTNVLDNAIYTGIHEGMKKGLLSFTQGILQMIQSAALRALEDRLYKILSKTGQSSGDEEEDGGGGGGFFGILKGLLGGLLGSGGGGGGGGGNSGPVGSGIGNFASGGFMSPNSWNIVGERGPELIRSGNSGATVLPNTGGNTYINFYVQNGAQLGSRDTQAQIARQMTRIQQKRALAG
jgi:hypothetical protein